MEVRDPRQKFVGVRSLVLPPLTGDLVELLRTHLSPADHPHLGFSPVFVVPEVVGGELASSGQEEASVSKVPVLSSNLAKLFRAAH